MTDSTTDTKNDKRSKPEPVRGVDGEPVRDFVALADAEAQAAALGRTVVAIGVAYHVADAE